MEEPATEGAAQRLIQTVLRHHAIIVGDRHRFRPSHEFFAGRRRAVRIQAGGFDQVDVVIQVHRMQVAGQAVELAIDLAQVDDVLRHTGEINVGGRHQVINRQQDAFSDILGDFRIMEHHYIGRVASGGGERQLREQVVPAQRCRLNDQAVFIVHIEAVEDGVEHLGIIGAGPAVHERDRGLRQRRARQHKQRHKRDNNNFQNRMLGHFESPHRLDQYQNIRTATIVTRLSLCCQQIRNSVCIEFCDSVASTDKTSYSCYIQSRFRAS